MQSLISNLPRRVTPNANSPTIKNSPLSCARKYKAAMCTMAKRKTTSCSTPKMEITSAPSLEHSPVALVIPINRTSDLHVGSPILAIPSWASLQQRGDMVSQGRSTQIGALYVPQYSMRDSLKWLWYFWDILSHIDLTIFWSSGLLELPIKSFVHRIQYTISCHFHL